LVLEIEWAEEDALPFPLCISAIGPPPKCELLKDISVARGNIILTDHGRQIDEPEYLGEVPVDKTSVTCKKKGLATEQMLVPGKFKPKLQKKSLTYGQPLQINDPASKMLIQDPRLAEPHLKLTGIIAHEDQAFEWHYRYDLLDSCSKDRHFVVEINNERIANLRFGDGELGKCPDTKTKFHALYRIGNGPTGNIGMETISHVVSRKGLLSGVELFPRNPFPAQGGTAPEPLDEVKMYAPHVFRKQLERAITEKDYAKLAENFPKVQRAAAALHWTGSWYEMLVAIDQKGRTEAEPEFTRSC
jgi:predicted phage baseplate assembly protein